MVTIAGMSDVHGMYEEILYPPADILCIAGDILRNYTHGGPQDGLAQLNVIPEFNRFLGKLKADKLYKEIIVVSGNHDFVFQHCKKEVKRLLTNAIYLEDSGVEVFGLKFWGSPWQPYFYDWAFNYPQDPNRSTSFAKTIWGMVPEDTDVLITHGPPAEILDLTPTLQEVGCPVLRNRVMDLRLKLHIFGHIHHSYGLVNVSYDSHETAFMNAAVCAENYEPVNPIQIVEV